MRRFAVIGVESPVGSALFNHLKPIASVTGLSLSDAVTESNAVDAVTDVVLCGDAAVSSWDDSFGGLKSDESIVPHLCRQVRRTSRRLVYVSSDSVFDGPWVFHDDDTPQSGRDATSHSLWSLEQQILRHTASLVIRTNALGDNEAGFLNRLQVALNGSGRIAVPSDVYATPLAADRMAKLLADVLQTDASGIVHLAGAERLSPWQLAQNLAGALCLDRSRLRPVAKSAPRERSLRCTRAISEFHLRMPTLSQTIDDLTGCAPVPQRQAA